MLPEHGDVFFLSVVKRDEEVFPQFVLHADLQLWRLHLIQSHHRRARTTVCHNVCEYCILLYLTLLFMFRSF